MNEIYEHIILWLKKNGFYKNDKSYRYLLSYLILSKQYKKASKFAKNNFLAKSLYYGHSELLVRNNYKNFLHVAERSQNWSLFIYLSELHRAISTTNSEEHQSQFLDNFELYFEAICSIYGTEKANGLLFFNGDKNYSNSITAKAFMILQEYGYSPQWKEVNELFEDSIALDDFKYFMCYLIQEDRDLNEYLTSVLPEKYTDYLRVFIIEVFKQKGFDVVFSLYKNIAKDKDENIALRINATLEETSCTQRIPVTSNEQFYELAPLDLSFVGDHIDKNELDRFYFNVEQHAHSDIETLMEFEKGIPSHNFFHNWIKYFIRLFLIEDKSSDTGKEKAVVENIKFLARDANRHNGVPRTMDFTYNNSGLITRTIERSLRHIVSKESWKDAITALIKIPHPTLPTIENKFLNNQNIHFIIDAYESFDRADNENYNEHAGYSFKKSIYYGKVGCTKKAKEELKKALLLITSYTFHKDRSLEEIIEPLSSINHINPVFAKKYSKKLKYLTDAVMKHTDDGKDTRWLTIEWYEQFLKVDYNLASMYLINELLTNEYFWKLDYMFIDFIQQSYDVDPIILNFLYKLSPKNTKDYYFSGFLDVLNKLEATDKKLAELSLTCLLTRDWNNSYDSLSKKTMRKAQSLKERLKISTPIKNDLSKSQPIIDTYQKKDLVKTLTKQLCRKTSLRDKTETELIKYYDKKDRLLEEDFNYLYFFLQENNNNKLATDLLMPITRKRFPSDGGEHFTQTCSLIEQLPLSNEIKVFLFINNFVYSKDGWFSSFVNKKSLKNAIEIDKCESLRVLAITLHDVFSNSNFLSKSTANLIIAFEYAGLEDESVLSMYKRSFDFIQNRLPDKNDFKWENVEDSEISGMNNNELAIVVILSKTKNLDAFVQKDVIVAISYLMKHDNTLLIKPFRWFFNCIERFHQLSVASILELFLIEIDNCPSLLNGIKGELKKASVIKNLYIHNTLQDILVGLEHE